MSKSPGQPPQPSSLKTDTTQSSQQVHQQPKPQARQRKSGSSRSQYRQASSQALDFSCNKFLEIFGFALFTFLAISYSYIQSGLHESFETQQSVQQSFSSISEAISDTTEDHFDAFWVWLATMRSEILVEEPQTGFFKLQSTPNYAVSDFHLTTRRVKEVPNPNFPSIKQWVATDFDPFTNAFDSDQDEKDSPWDTSPFMLDTPDSESLLTHTTANTYRGLGGFSFAIPIDQPRLAFLQQLDYLRNDSGFAASNTVSVVADVTFYNKVTRSFVYVALKASRRPSGLIHYAFEFHKPVGAYITFSENRLLVSIKYAQWLIVTLYATREVFYFTGTLCRYLSEKDLKSRSIALREAEEKESGADEGVLGKKLPSGDDETFEQRVDKILSLKQAGSIYDSSDFDTKANRDLLKFYWDDEKQAPVADGGPSCLLACKTTLRLDQRLHTYLFMFLLVPLSIMHFKWMAEYDHFLGGVEQSLDSSGNPTYKVLTDDSKVSFIDIVDRQSPWRQVHSDSDIVNSLLYLMENAETQYVVQSLCLFFVILRMVLIVAELNQAIAGNLALLAKISHFMVSFMLPLVFIFLAWSMCQHILFGHAMVAYSTPMMSLVSTTMIALRDFTELDRMYALEPNTTILLFIFFVIAVMFFLVDIFISLVILVYNEIALKDEKSLQKTPEQILEQEHWVYSFARVGKALLAKTACQRRKRSKCMSCLCRVCCCCCGERGGLKDDYLDHSTRKREKMSWLSNTLGRVTKFASQADEFDDDQDDGIDNERLETVQITQERSRNGQSLSNLREEKEPNESRQRHNNGERSDFCLESQLSEPSLGGEYSASQGNMEDSQVGQKWLTESDITVTEESDRVAPFGEGARRRQGPARELVTFKEPTSLVSGTTQAAGSIGKLPPEDSKKLLQMNWNKRFEVYDLGADLEMDSRHTSNKQDAYMTKQREQRCGKVIWTTALSLVYMFLYLYLIDYRFPIESSHGQNKDLEEIIWHHRFDYQTKAGNELSNVLLEELAAESAVLAFLESFENELIIERPFDLSGLSDDQGTTTSTGQDGASTQVGLYYLSNTDNYLVLQSFTYCASLQIETFSSTSEQNLSQLVTPIDYRAHSETNRHESEFKRHVLEGTGGYCFDFFLSEPERPNKVFRAILQSLREELAAESTSYTDIKVQELEVSFLVAEAAVAMVTDVDLTFKKKADGLVKIGIQTRTGSLEIDLMVIFWTSLFMLVFLTNGYLFVSGECAIRARYNKWYLHNITPLSKIELKQRYKYEPQVFRAVALILRPSSIAYLTHIALTVYTEVLYMTSFVELTVLNTSLSQFPAEPIQADLLSVAETAAKLHDERLDFQEETKFQFDSLLEARTTYRRLAILNLLLVISLPLNSASQSSRFRYFLTALGQTVRKSFELYLILFCFSLSILFYGLQAFGFEAEDFQTFSYSSMTIFKMMVGRLVGQYYQVVLKISLWQALFFTLPVILMKSIFVTVFLAVVCYVYEKEVLNKENTSNINILRSVFFCNIQHDKRHQNKRAKELSESEALAKLGGGLGPDQADHQGAGGGNEAQGSGDERDLDHHAVDAQVAAPIGLGLGQATIHREGGLKSETAGLEIFNKMDLKFEIQKKVQEWSMGCADEIKQEVANRKRLKQEAIYMAQKLSQSLELEGANAKARQRNVETQRLNSLNLIVARTQYIQYLWYGIQFFYFQGELIRKVISTTEAEIDTLLSPLFTPSQKKQLTKLLRKQQTQSTSPLSNSTSPDDPIQYFNPITSRSEQVTLPLLENASSLYELERRDREVKDYLVLLSDEVEARLQRIKKQWHTMQLQGKHKRILKALLKKENLFKYMP